MQSYPTALDLDVVTGLEHSSEVAGASHLMLTNASVRPGVKCMWVCFHGH